MIAGLPDSFREVSPVPAEHAQNLTVRIRVQRLVTAGEQIDHFGPILDPRGHFVRMLAREPRGYVIRERGTDDRRRVTVHAGWRPVPRRGVRPREASPDRSF